jgi:hypothetical protein
MAEVLTCPKCDRKLQVPETLMGQDVQCPTCRATFLAQLGGATVEPAPAPARKLDHPKRRAEFDDDDDDFSFDRSRMRRRGRRNYEPHRGSMIMTLGIVSLVFAHLILGPIAWIMANHDLEAMRMGKMDPEGESSTRTGRTCGMISTILGIVALMVGIAFFCLWFFAVAAIMGTAGSKRGKGF